MSRAFFFDTSALMKFYHPEVGTDQVETIFQHPDSVLIISELATVELYAALARKVRMGEISPEAQHEAYRNFDDDCLHRFVIQSLTGAVIQKAKSLIQQYSNTKALRSLDSLQLGACLRTLGQNLGVIFPSICYSKTFFYFSSSCKGFVP